MDTDGLQGRVRNCKEGLQLLDNVLVLERLCRDYQCPVILGAIGRARCISANGLEEGDCEYTSVAILRDVGDWRDWAQQHQKI